MEQSEGTNSVKDKPEEGNAWKSFQKISVPLSIIYTLVALVIGIITLSDWLSDDYEIYATGDHYLIRHPDTLVNFLDYLGRSLESKEHPFAEIDFYRTRSRLLELNSVWVYTIKNEGLKNVTDLRLKLPFRGHCRVERAGETPHRREFDKLIKIGDLQPDNDVLVTVWTSGLYGSESYYEDQTSISHANGRAKIHYAVPVYGFFAWLNRNWVPLLFFSIAVVLLILLSSVFRGTQGAKEN